MTVYGYARVSTDGQTLASQDAQLHAAGCAKVYSEKVSGAQTDRAELAKLLKRLDEGDVLVVTRLDRLARSTRDLLNILDTVAKAGAGFRSTQPHRAVAAGRGRRPRAHRPGAAPIPRPRPDLSGGFGREGAGVIEPALAHQDRPANLALFGFPLDK